MLTAQEERTTAQLEFNVRLIGARRRTDELFQIVKESALYDRPIPERHRIVFYLGHLEAFDWNLLGGRVFGLKSFHPEFDKLFAFGIDPVGGGLPDDRASDWPAMHPVQEYAAKIRRALDENLTCVSFDTLIDGFPLSTLLNVALEHRLMHAETLAYMLHQLPLDRKVSQKVRIPSDTNPLSPIMLDIPAGPATLGQNRSDGKFGWDNEFEAEAVHVPAFAIDRYKVTNQQYLEFMTAGGYERSELWEAADWSWRSTQNISHPIFWKRAGEGWLYRGMFEEVPLPSNAPVYVSQAEAKAYSRWAGKQLPTEPEWHRAAFGQRSGSECSFPWGDKAPSGKLGNFDFADWDPVPVNLFSQGQSAFGVQDMLGNGWEWTSTIFGPLPGFEVFPFYRGYSADFFDGKHFVMKGASPRTAACMLRRSFRNWFQPHYQYVYAGFRCVQR